jgi:hypothetical protein
VGTSVRDGLHLVALFHLVGDDRYLEWWPAKDKSSFADESDFTLAPINGYSGEVIRLSLPKIGSVLTELLDLGFDQPKSC